MKLVDCLQSDHDVDIYATETVDGENLAEMNKFAATEVDSETIVDQPYLIKSTNAILNKLNERQLVPEDISTAFRKVRDAFYLRHIKKVSEEYDLIIHTEQGLAIGLGTRYELHPKIKGETNNSQQKIEIPSLEGYNAQTLYYRHWPYVIVQDESYNRYWGLTDMLNSLCHKIVDPSFRTDSSKKSFVGNSEWTADYIRNEFDIDVDVVYPPVDVADIAPYREPWQSREEGFVSMGRLSSSKRQLMMIDIIDELNNRNIETHLHLVGPDGSGGYSDRVIDRAEASEYVTYEGLVDRERLLELLGQHKYGIHGKQHEHFGIAVAEMAAAGMIPFIPDSGGQTEIIDQKELQYDSKQECIENIMDIIDNSEKQSHLHNQLTTSVEDYTVSRFENEIRRKVDRLV